MPPIFDRGSRADDRRAKTCDAPLAKSFERLPARRAYRIGSAEGFGMGVYWKKRRRKESLPLPKTKEQEEKMMRRYWKKAEELKETGVCALRRLLRKGGALLHDESGMGTIEMVLLIVVLITLVLIFRTRIAKVLDKILDQINSSASGVWEGQT